MTRSSTEAAVVSDVSPGVDKPTAQRPGSTEQQGREAAEAFRRDHQLGRQPLGDLLTLIEQATGCDVAIVEGDPDEHGMVMRDPVTKRIYIAVARTSHPMRQRSSLAHELAHVVFEDWHDGDLAERSPAERRADAFARHLLIPEAGVRDFFTASEPLTEADLSSVVQHFQVSPAMAAIALSNCGFIDENTKDGWKSLSTPALATRFGWREQYRALSDAANRVRAPQRLLARAITGYGAGVVSPAVIASLRGLSADAVVEELTAAGITPPSVDVPWASEEDMTPAGIDLSDLDADFEAGENGD